MLLKELIKFKLSLPQSAREIIPEDMVLLVYTDNGMLSSGTLGNHDSIYNDYKIVNYDYSCEGFLYIEEV